jgi:hypothetical protein
MNERMEFVMTLDDTVRAIKKIESDPDILRQAARMVGGELLNGRDVTTAILAMFTVNDVPPSDGITALIDALSALSAQQVKAGMMDQYLVDLAAHIKERIEGYIEARKLLREALTAKYADRAKEFFQ